MGALTATVAVTQSTSMNTLKPGISWRGVRRRLAVLATWNGASTHLASAAPGSADLAAARQARHCGLAGRLAGAGGQAAAGPAAVLAALSLPLPLPPLPTPPDERKGKPSG